MYCVIVGDIVNSRVMTQEDRSDAGVYIQRVFDRINSDYHMYLLSDFEFASGDSFEAVLLAHYKAVEITQRIIKELYPICRIRISIAIGELYTLSKYTKSVNSIDGPAFHIASDMINAQKKSKSNHFLQLRIHTSHKAQVLLDALINLLEVVTIRWTNRQRQVAWDYERFGEDILLLSQAMGISVAAIRKHLKAAGYSSYHLAWKAMEEYLADSFMSLPYYESCDDYLLHLNAACHYYDSKDYLSAENCINKSLVLAEKRFSSNSQMLVPVLHVLSEILLKLGSFQELIKVSEKSLDIQNELPPGRNSYIITLMLLGLAQQNLGMVDLAKSTLEKVKAIETTMSGESSSNQLYWERITNRNI